MNFKDLEKLLKLARKYGLTAVKTQDIEFTLTVSHKSDISSRKSDFTSAITNVDEIEMPDLLSAEDLLFYSASGQTVPEN